MKLILKYLKLLLLLTHLSLIPCKFRSSNENKTYPKSNI